MKIGAMELIVIFIVALLVIGPDKLPSYAKKFGNAMREFRKASSDMTQDIRESVVEPLEEAQRPLREAMEPLETLKKDVEGSFKGVEKDLKNIGKPAPKDKDKKAEAAADAEDSAAEDSSVQDSVPAEGTASTQAQLAAEPVSAPEAADSDVSVAENDQETTGGTT